MPFLKEYSTRAKHLKKEIRHDDGGLYRRTE